MALWECAQDTNMIPQQALLGDSMLSPGNNLEKLLLVLVLSLEVLTTSEKKNLCFWALNLEQCGCECWLLACSCFTKAQQPVASRWQWESLFAGWGLLKVYVS